MKKLTVEIEDDTKTELVENVEVQHLCDLGGEVKEAIDEFVKMNEGTVMPPVSIQVSERKEPASSTGAGGKS